MTTTTEELKREMYGLLEDCKGVVRNGWVPVHNLAVLENALETYLEALRQEAEGLKQQGGILLDAYANQQELTRQARAEADRERNRVQAFEFANKSAGEFLQAARAKVKAQRQHFGKLKNERDNFERTVKVRTSQRDGLEFKLLEARKELSELRKLVGSTSHQDSNGNSTGAICGPLPSPCKHSFQYKTVYTSLKIKKQCIFCMTIEELP